MSAAPIVPTDLSRIPDALKETPHWDLYQLVQGEDKPVMLPNGRMTKGPVKRKAKPDKFRTAWPFPTTGWFRSTTDGCDFAGRTTGKGISSER